jgi:hypothetical protein
MKVQKQGKTIIIVATKEEWKGIANSTLNIAENAVRVKAARDLQKLQKRNLAVKAVAGVLRTVFLK